jgi:hypothetical protein
LPKPILKPSLLIPMGTVLALLHSTEVHHPQVSDPSAKKIIFNNFCFFGCKSKTVAYNYYATKQRKEKFQHLEVTVSYYSFVF